MEVHLDIILYRIYLLNNKTFVPLILVLHVSLRSIERMPLKITLRDFFASQKTTCSYPSFLSEGFNSDVRRNREKSKKSKGQTQLNS